MTPCDRCARVQAENERLRKALEAAARSLAAVTKLQPDDDPKAYATNRSLVARAELSRSGP